MLASVIASLRAAERSRDRDRQRQRAEGEGRLGERWEQGAGVKLTEAR